MFAGIVDIHIFIFSLQHPFSNVLGTELMCSFDPRHVINDTLHVHVNIKSHPQYMNCEYSKSNNFLWQDFCGVSKGVYESLHFLHGSFNLLSHKPFMGHRAND